jgi:2-phospho-L-lactate guanylyltransferase
MSDRTSITAVVPMKPLAESKTRLGGHLSDDERAELSAAMLRSVLGALRDSSVSETVVVGGDHHVRAIASDGGVRWKPDRFLDLNLAVDDEFGSVWRSGRVAAYIPADLPLVTVAEVDDMLNFAAGSRAITICPAHDGGTNGLVVPPCRGFSPRLGSQSHRRHRELAAELGIEVREFCSPGFVLDVDTIDDLCRCLDRSPSFMQSLSKASGVFYR